MEDLVLTSLWLGFALGLTHALDPDHLVAVGTMAVESESIRRSSALGIFWGMGHTMALALIGGVVLTLKWTIPEFLATGMEAIIAMMIIFLGGSLVWHAAQSLTVHSHAHTHGDTQHSHFHTHPRGQEIHHSHFFGSGHKAFAVGMVHGIAGSAVLTLAVMTTMPSTLLGLFYILVFGVGSIGGMLFMSSVMSLPFVLTSGWIRPWQTRLKDFAGFFAMAFGGYLAWSLLA